jgi:hypothetical protein
MLTHSAMVGQPITYAMSYRHFSRAEILRRVT